MLEYIWRGLATPRLLRQNREDSTHYVHIEAEAAAFLSQALIEVPAVKTFRAWLMVQSDSRLPELLQCDLADLLSVMTTGPMGAFTTQDAHVPRVMEQQRSAPHVVIILEPKGMCLDHAPDSGPVQQMGNL